MCRKYLIKEDFFLQVTERGPLSLQLHTHRPTSPTSPLDVPT